MAHILLPFTILKFLIPVRHPSNSKNWAQLKANLTQTVRSIAGQQNKDRRGLIVANRGSDLPALPAQFDVEWVDFAPNTMHERRPDLPKEQFLDAFRIDKGSRVLKGMLRARCHRVHSAVTPKVNANEAEKCCAHTDLLKKASGQLPDQGSTTCVARR